MSSEIPYFTETNQMSVVFQSVKLFKRNTVMALEINVISKQFL